MIGRLDAPGAKLDPVMPGFPNSMSPSVPPGLRRISSLGTTVTVANWSVTIGRVPGSVASAGAAGACSAGAGACEGALGRRAGVRCTIGLGARTTTSGNTVCARVASLMTGNAANAEPITITFVADLNIVDIKSAGGPLNLADPELVVRCRLHFAAQRLVHKRSQRARPAPQR